MWQDSEKNLHVVILIGPFVPVLVVAQLAQTFNPPPTNFDPPLNSS